MEQGSRQYRTAQDKFLVPDELLDSARIQVGWALGTETLVLSCFRFGRSITMCGPEKTKTCGGNNYIRSKDFCVPVQTLNKSYFFLSDSNYVFIRKP